MVAPAGFLHAGRDDHGRAGVAAAIAVVITFAVNAPLNDALAQGWSREAFEAPWVLWHVRTAAAATAFVLLSIPSG
jgi:hypothetical protein